jgi:hypothetical protein
MSSIEKRAHKFSNSSHFKLTYVIVVQSIGMNFNLWFDVHNLKFFGLSIVECGTLDHWIQQKSRNCMNFSL